MKNKLFLMTTISFLLLSGCTHHAANNSNVTDSNDIIPNETATISSGSWAYEKFVKFKTITYLVSDEKVASTDIQMQIGAIEHASDNESDENYHSRI
ncbi:hypothetical protein [Paenibacillus popilliae]|uniref:Uncharacterized protein n=1 Tax=Paenibacillus popilliae TaxID=78057 RepID=A0ABY3AWQ8_PAEPP|nr:hypothetical protein [Paenibacillus sp. SDF0028]TQR46399.1 hypothetical protein C7Y44_01575 [Paenibacillus sp. SDF0028]